MQSETVSNCVCVALHFLFHVDRCISYMYGGVRSRVLVADTVCRCPSSWTSPAPSCNCVMMWLCFVTSVAASCYCKCHGCENNRRDTVVKLMSLFWVFSVHPLCWMAYECFFVDFEILGQVHGETLRNRSTLSRDTNNVGVPAQSAHPL